MEKRASILRQNGEREREREREREMQRGIPLRERSPKIGRDVIGKLSPATKLLCDDIDRHSCAPEIWTARRRAF